MVGKRTNVLREFHLLVLREAEGFSWQIRYDRHAEPVERCPDVFKTYQDALTAGEKALEHHRGTIKNGA